MKPVEWLQGKWLGHPLHPALAHIPVGTWLAAAVLDIVGATDVIAGPVEYLSVSAVIFGLVFALLAVPTGIADWSSIKREKPAWKLGVAHLALNLLAAVCWAANLGLRWHALSSANPITPAVLITSIVGAVLVLVSGYIGSLMVFDHGISVGRQSKKRWRRIAAAGGARLPEEK